MPTFTDSPSARLPQPAQTVQLQIQATAGVDHCIITRVSATPYDQARVMYENCVKHGLESQYRLYGPFGDKVLDVYRAHQLESKLLVIAKMSECILAIGPENVSHHCSLTHYVWDVDPASIPVDKQAAYLAAIQSHPLIVKWFSPFTEPKDPAFHVEILKSAILSPNK